MAVRVARPDHAFIGNHTYSIDWLTVDEWQGRDYPMDKDGLTYGATSTICMRLLSGRREALYQEVLLHEITHAVWDSVGFSLTDDWHNGEPHDVEERTILLQTPMLLFTLKQNPDLTKYLLSDGTVVRS